MSAQYSTFARPNLDASFFDREEAADAAPMFATPVYAQRTSTKSARSGINPAWIAVPAVVVAVGAGAFFMSQRNEPVVASTKPPVAVMAPVAAPQPEMVANTVQPLTPSPAATATASTSGRIMTRQPAPIRVARAKAPATTQAATAATGTGMDASATVPASPQPYTGSAQAQAPAPVIAPPAAAQPVNPTPEAITPEATTPPIAPQVPETSPPTN